MNVLLKNANLKKQSVFRALTDYECICCEERFKHSTRPAPLICTECEVELKENLKEVDVFLYKRRKAKRGGVK